MIELIRVAAEVQCICEAENWGFCFIGGLALQRWGEPRETVRVDLTVLAGFGSEQRFVDRLLQSFQGRIDDAAKFALTRRVLLLRSHSGVGIDVALGGLPFEESAVTRSSLFEFPSSVRLRTCSAEDLVVMKLLRTALGKTKISIPESRKSLKRHFLSSALPALD